jgi:glycosyltransferase involved in cell wall biosynthesis
MTSTPDVSVVIPTRDRHELLTRAVAGALAQRGVDVEVIVVDDGSREPIECGPDPRVRVVRHDVARGVATARNRGIAEALAPWVAFLDDDDLWSPDKLGTQLDAAAREGASFAYAAAVVVDGQLRVLRTVPAPEPASLAEALVSLNVMPAGCSNVVARSSLLRELGGFDEQLCQLADWDLWRRLAASGVAAATAEALVAYLLHPQNMLLTSEPDVAEELRYLDAKSARPEVDPVRFARWVAGGRLRAGRKGAAARTLLSAGLAHRDLGSLVRGLAAPLGEGAMFAYWRLRSGRSRGPKWLDAYRFVRETCDDGLTGRAGARTRAVSGRRHRSGRAVGGRSRP